MATTAPAGNGTVGPVEVVKLEDWKSKDGKREGRNLHFKINGGATMRLPIAASVNGGAPAAGEICTLLIEVYPWHDARNNQQGEAYPVVLTKTRVVGKAA